MGGFSYRGKNIGDFGEIYYIPDAAERGAYAQPYDVSEQEVGARDGAYYYGNKVKPREFSLKCYYEDLTQQTKEDIIHWFGRNTKGRLIFDDRDYVFYNVIPDERIEFEDYRGMTCSGQRYKGIQTIHLKAYDPFGRLMLDKAGLDLPMVGINALVDISILGRLNAKEAVETLILSSAISPNGQFVPSDTRFLFYNPGTERTPLLIKMAGDAEDGTITNLTNGSSCTVVEMTSAKTSGVGKTLNIDAETGRVTLVGLSGTELAFEMHDRGYIWLEPCTEFIRDIRVTYTANSSTVTAEGGFTEDVVGQYIYIGEGWHKIAEYNSATSIAIADTMASSGYETTNIVTMNEISLDGFTLTQLEMSYSPRVR